MNDVLKIFLSLSLSGTLLIFIFLMLKHFLKNKVSRQWQYYIWLIVIARLLLPFAPEVNLIGITFQSIDQAILQKEISQSTQVDTSISQNIDAPVLINDETNQSGTYGEIIALPNNQPLQDVITLLVNNIWLVWLVVALVLIIRKITIYQSFVRYVEAGLTPVTDIELLDRMAVIGEQAGVKRAVDLCVNPLISSPLLIGFFRPHIVLPSADISETDFRYTVLHELTHFRRRDMFYKWLAQLTICLHWFNPFVYLMGREMNNACEFSCDEAIISKLNSDDVRDYGKTLLDAMAAVGKYKEVLASVTLSENKKLLKERLGAIMKFKNPSKVVRLSTALLTVAIIFGATFTGAYAAVPDRIASTGNTKETGSVVLNLSSDGQDSIQDSSSFEAKANQTLVLDIQSSITGGTVDLFLFSPSGKEQRITIGGSDKTETVTLTAGRWAYNCTGFFKGGEVTIKGQLSALAAIPNQTAPTESTIETDPVAFYLSSDGQNSILHSSSFEAKANQTLVLNIQSSISGGTVDFFLFSPTGQEQRITIGGSDKTETVTLTAGRWAYNCTGFFESGAVAIKGRLSVLEENQEEYDVKLDKIGINQVVCIGQINLNKDVAYRIDITADSGDGLFVGLQSSSQITSLKGVAFDQRYGTAGRAINAYFNSAESESYYVYVGNEGNTNLTEIKGVLYLAKEIAEIPDQTASSENTKIA